MLQKNYIIQLRTILSKNGVGEDLKEEMVLIATNNRTSSIREMTTQEAIKMIRQLNGEQDQYNDRKQKMKRKILAICHEMGWEDDRGKVDMKRVNAFCEKRGYLNKSFDDYTTSELPKLITQFERLNKSYNP